VLHIFITGGKKGKTWSSLGRVGVGLQSWFRKEETAIRVVGRKKEKTFLYRRGSLEENTWGGEIIKGERSDGGV